MSKLRFKEIKKRLAQNGAESIPIDIPVSYLKTMLQIEWKSFFYEKRYSIDKSLFSKVSSTSTLKSSIDRCFRETNTFSHFRFEDKIDNFWKNF